MSPTAAQGSAEMNMMAMKTKLMAVIWRNFAPSVTTSGSAPSKRMTGAATTIVSGVRTSARTAPATTDCFVMRSPSASIRPAPKAWAIRTVAPIETEKKAEMTDDLDLAGRSDTGDGRRAQPGDHQGRYEAERGMQEVLEDRGPGKPKNRTPDFSSIRTRSGRAGIIHPTVLPRGRQGRHSISIDAHRLRTKEHLPQPGEPAARHS